MYKALKIISLAHWPLLPTHQIPRIIHDYQGNGSWTLQVYILGVKFVVMIKYKVLQLEMQTEALTRCT